MAALASAMKMLNVLGVAGCAERDKGDVAGRQAPRGETKSMTTPSGCRVNSMMQERLRKGSWTSPLPSPHLQCSAEPEGLDLDYEWLLDMVDVDNAASRFDRVVDMDAAHGVHIEGARHFLTEQLYSYPGSLPRALTLSERERVLRVLQPTATFEMLNRIPAERLSPDDSSTEPRTSKPDVGRSKRAVSKMGGKPSASAPPAGEQWWLLTKGVPKGVPKKSHQESFRLFITAVENDPVSFETFVEQLRLRRFDDFCAEDEEVVGAAHCEVRRSTRCKIGLLESYPYLVSL
eukprot:g25837.t1